MVRWQNFEAVVVPGHRVASGGNGNPRFPGGTLFMQAPHFRERGLDLSQFFQGTINVSIAPLVFRVRSARHTFRAVKWHPVEPAEDFSFFDVRLIRPDQDPLPGLVYFPHPETKPEHFQQPDVLELLFPCVEDLCYGVKLKLEIPDQQLVIAASEA